MSEQPVGTEIAGYRIESVIGRGGMAVVYRAEDTRLGRKVALKLLTPALGDQEQFKLRFIQESRLAASLDHPNIIPIYEAGNAEGLLFIVMRYVVGSDLKVALAGGTPLTPARTVRLFEQIGDALDAAHELGLVHRDVKPGNVLLTSVHERSDHVYLTDFGLTKRASSLTGGLTGTGHFLGTIDYVAPEQIAGKPVDARTDIYALGCVLYESLTGQVPFHREDDAATLWAHLVEPPPPVTAVRPDLSPAVGAVIARAMAKDQEDRYGSCHEMVQDLEQALEVVPSRGRAASGGVGASWPAGQLEREHEQQTHITDAPPHEPPDGPPHEPPDASPYEPPDASPDEPQHPSFPPGIVDVRSGSRYPEQGEESGPTWEEVDEELAPEGSLGDIGWESEDEPARSAPPPARSSKRGRWWLVAVLAVVAAFAVVAALVLLPSKKSPTLSGTYTSSSSVFKAYVGSFSLNTPADWGPREGPSVSVILSPGVEAVDQLFSQASWAAVRNLLSTNRSNASGLWITARDTPYGGTPQELVKSGALPNLSKITSSPQNRLVGDMPSDEMQGQLEDPDDQTVRLQFVVNVVRYHKAQSTASMLVVFFAPPDKFNHQRPLFDQVRSTIRFS